MSLNLNQADLDALAEAIRTLVSPLDHATVEDWRRSMHDATRILFRADQTMTIMAGGGPLVVSEDVDASVLRSLRTWFDPISPEGHLVMADGVVNEWNNRRRESGLHVFTRDVIDRVIQNRVLESPYVNEALIPNGIHFWQGLYGKGVGGSEAVLWVSYDRPESKRFGEGTVDVLSLLVPAFHAGLDALARIHTASSVLDDLAHPMLVFDRTGREIHRSPMLASVLTDEATSPVLARARSLAREFAAGLPAAGQPAGLVAPSTAHLSAGGRDYTLRVTLLPAGLLATDATVAVLVVPRAPPTLPDREVLQAVHGLTPREAEVALHLATGATRDRIARDLGLSPHTVRAHTEKVFMKLGVSTRSAVAAALVGGVDPRRPRVTP
ncbi:MAG: helix-turn-helix transcriptional regulator [Longimicrobiales bacterium]|nr:helix-turn-helix transcriptional regulator [Longimicrobiales bacterium]